MKVTVYLYVLCSLDNNRIGHQFRNFFFFNLQPRLLGNSWIHDTKLPPRCYNVQVLWYVTILLSVKLSVSCLKFLYNWMILNILKRPQTTCQWSIFIETDFNVYIKEVLKQNTNIRPTSTFLVPIYIYEPIYFLEHVYSKLLAYIIILYW